jgi:hypothetical protein
MIAQALRGPHNLYRRYQAVLERAVTATALAALVMLALFAIPAYPANWVQVIGITVAFLALRWPLAAYLALVAAMVYPIYTVNLYLAVIFLAVSALGQRFFVHYMGAALFVLATPLLAKYHLHWLVPILGGLLWGSSSGAWIGGLAAVWGKFLGGMAGLDMDWLALAGQTPQSALMVSRFQEANSLETLLLLIEPFATTNVLILYHLLQIAGWIVAGAFVGALAGRQWIKYRAPWSILIVTAGGGLIMLATHLGLPLWLPEAVTPAVEAVFQDPSGPLFSLIVVIIVSTTVHSLRESLELPVAPRRKIWPKRQGTTGALKLPTGKLFGRPKIRLNRKTGPTATAHNDLDPIRRPVRVPHHSELPEWEPPKDESGLIMLEID